MCRRPQAPRPHRRRAFADAGIPEFWLTAMTNHEMVGELITERDAEVGPDSPRAPLAPPPPRAPRLA
jgi:hypothetical protein